MQRTFAPPAGGSASTTREVSAVRRGVASQKPGYTTSTRVTSAVLRRQVGGSVEL